jgi:amidase
MGPADFGEWDAVGLAQRVHAGDVTPAELTEAAIAAIERLNPRLNAVVEQCFDQAREAAERVDRKAPLAGVPFLAKDLNIDVAGLHLTASCRWLAELPAARVDAPLAARWRTAGLSILGRTNTPEFAAEFVTEPTWRGPTHNPWDLTLTPGGSSGGAAAAVAAGMVPLAHATDSGGSIRVPAAACGLVGFKPSRGLVPVGPHLDELAGGFDCEHALTRTVRDTATLLDLTAGPELMTRQPLRLPPAGFRAALETRPQPLRIGLVLKAPGGSVPDEEIGAAVETIGALLARAGHQVSAFEFPATANLSDAALVIWLTAIAEEIEFYRTQVGRPPERHELEALTWEALSRANRYSALDYVRARRALSVATRDMAAEGRHFDVLLLPTTASLPVKIGQIDGRTAAFDLDQWNAASYGYAPYTEVFNATGQPAVSLPLAVSKAGLPIGIQFAARLGEDELLLSLAAWLEREVPWAPRLAALRARWA